MSTAIPPGRFIDLDGDTWRRIGSAQSTLYESETIPGLQMQFHLIEKLYGIDRELNECTDGKHKDYGCACTHKEKIPEIRWSD